MRLTRRTAPRPAIAALALLALTLLPAGRAHADRESATDAVAIYLTAVAEQGEPTPEMLDAVVRRLGEALPTSEAIPLLVDRMLVEVADPTSGAALVMVLDELGLPRHELLAAAVDRIAHDDDVVRSGAAVYLGGFLVRPEIDIETKLLLLELLEPVATHAAPLAPSLLALQLLQHGRNTPSMITAIERLLATALPDPNARALHGVPGLVELARADEGNLRGLAMLKLGQWGLATPAAVEVLLENLTYENPDPALARRVRIVAAQTLGDLAASIARLGPELGFRAQRELVAAGAKEPDEDVRNLIVHVGTQLGQALSRTVKVGGKSGGS